MSYYVPTFNHISLKLQEKDSVIAAFVLRTFANLLGGIANYYGSLKVKQDSKDEDFVYDSPKWVLSFTPSREIFPRGFLWDDGFHILVYSIAY